MAFQIPEKIQRLTAYEPENGDVSLRLEANESVFPLGDRLQKIVETAVRSLDLRRYPDPCAVELCKAASSFFGVQEDQIVAGCGSDELIMVIINAFAGENGCVLVSEPDFSMYRFYSEISGAACVATDKSNGQVDIDALLKAADREKASVIIFSNPCNPTGSGISAQEVLRLCKNTQALVVVDEAYMDFWNESILDQACSLPNVLVLKTCSKAIGLAGIRVGFAIGNATLVEAIKKVKSPYNVSATSQAIAAALLKEKEELLYRRREIIDRTRELYDGLNALAKRNPGRLAPRETNTNFVYIPCKEADSLWSQLLQKGILVRKFNGALRITAGTREENDSVLKTLEELLEV